MKEYSHIVVERSVKNSCVLDLSILSPKLRFEKKSAFYSLENLERPNTTTASFPKTRLLSDFVDVKRNMSRREESADLTRKRPTSIDPPRVFIKQKTEAIVKMPLSAGKALIHFNDQLSDWEKKEMIKYNQIYFIGNLPKHLRDKPNNADLMLLEGSHLVFRYEIKGLLGIGLDFKAYEAFDWKGKFKVVLKLIKSQDYITKSIEIEVLKLFENKKPPVPYNKLIDTFYHLEHFFVVVKFLGPPLSCKNLKLSEIFKYSLDILASLSFLHHNSIIYKNLQPDNILIGYNSKATLINYSKSCYKGQCSHNSTQKISYKPPEVLLKLPCTDKSDIWSFGCVLFEMCTGKALFSVESERDLLKEMIKVIGLPPKSLLNGLNTLNNSENFNLDYKSSIEHQLNGTHPEIITFIKTCIEWDSEKRISSLKGLNTISLLARRVLYLNI
jgi:dual specificity tyrosine-phosphorylation-regulated kinase 2/3/4